jgi:predicted ATPase
VRGTSKSQPVERIYFDGCEGSGKTTLARETAALYGLRLLTEVASGVLHEYQQRVGERASTWERIRADVRLSAEVQERVLDRQLADELATPPPAVYDRTLSCLAYAELYADNFGELLDRVPREYIENLRRATVFLVRPQRDLLGLADGVRAVVSWENQVRVDQTIETLLQLWRVDYVSVDVLCAAARRRLVDYVLRLRGFERKTVK